MRINLFIDGKPICGVQPLPVSLQGPEQQQHQTKRENNLSQSLSGLICLLFARRRKDSLAKGHNLL